MPVGCKEQETAKRRIFHSTGTPSHAPASPAASVSQESLSFVALGEPLSAAQQTSLPQPETLLGSDAPSTCRTTRRARCLAVAVETARRIACVAAGPGCLRHQHQCITYRPPIVTHRCVFAWGLPFYQGCHLPQARPGPHARAPPTHVVSVQRNNEPLSFTTGANCISKPCCHLSRPTPSRHLVGD